MYRPSKSALSRPEKGTKNRKTPQEALLFSSLLLVGKRSIAGWAPRPTAANADQGACAKKKRSIAGWGCFLAFPSDGLQQVPAAWLRLP